MHAVEEYPSPAVDTPQNGSAQILALKEEFNQHQPKLEGEIPLPNGTVDLGRGEVRYRDGQSSAISGREMALLQYLAHNAGRIISRQELLLQVWRMNPQFVITRTIDMHIAKLRDKLRDNPQKPSILATVRGEGYIWKTVDGCCQAA